jgi:putative DNA primase/helicase
VFYGSVNENEFLSDSTGNRRFWVVRVKSINYNHKLDMQQVWAEVKSQHYDAGEGWFLTGHERELLNESNETEPHAVSGRRPDPAASQL